MKAPLISVPTPHGTFTRSTYNAYRVIAVLQMAHNDGPWAIWSRDLDKARKNCQRLNNARVFGFYSVADGSQVAPGMTIHPPVSAAAARAAREAAKPVVVHEFEKCSECERRHDPARLRCGNCWRCHEPTTKCGTTKAEIAASIERHNNYPEFYRVQTNVWRPWDEVTVPQCACHSA